MIVDCYCPSESSDPEPDYALIDAAWDARQEDAARRYRRWRDHAIELVPEAMTADREPEPDAELTLF
jgi:hypothetical protein